MADLCYNEAAQQLAGLAARQSGFERLLPLERLRTLAGNLGASGVSAPHAA